MNSDQTTIRGALEQALALIDSLFDQKPLRNGVWADGLSPRLLDQIISTRRSLDVAISSQHVASEVALERPDTLTDLCDALYEAGHEFWEACRREAGGGAVRWVDYADGTLIVFTRWEYRDRLLSTIGRDYSAPVVVFEQPSDDDSYSGVTAKIATPPANAEFQSWLATPADLEIASWSAAPRREG